MSVLSDPHDPLSYIATLTDTTVYTAFVLIFAVDQCAGFGMVGAGEFCVTTRPWEATIFETREQAAAAVIEHKQGDPSYVVPVIDVAKFKACHDSWDCEQFEHNVD